MAISDDAPGFIVHGHSGEEVAKKIVPAYMAFRQAVGDGDDEYYQVQPA